MRCADLEQQRSDYGIQLQEAREGLAEMQGHLQALQEEGLHKEQALQDRDEQLHRASDENQKLLRSYNEKQAAFTDLDTRIKTAQAHLGKKVKENTMLRDHIDKQKMQILELQNHLNTEKSESSKLQNALDLHRKHAEKVQNMANDQAKEWQEKFFALQQQTQQDKIRISELEKIEAEYRQMYNVFSKIKTFIGASATLPQPPMSGMSGIADNAAAIDITPPSSPSSQLSAVQDSLFSSPSSPPPRKTLFE